MCRVETCQEAESQNELTAPVHFHNLEADNINLRRHQSINPWKLKRFYQTISGPDGSQWMYIRRLSVGDQMSKEMRCYSPHTIKLKP